MEYDVINPPSRTNTRISPAILLVAFDCKFYVIVTKAYVRAL